MKFSTLVLLALSIPTLLLASLMPSHGQSIRVVIDGNWMDFSATPPIEQNGSVLVPLRGVFEQLGADVNYSADTRSIEATRGSTDVILRLGQDTAYVNGQAEPLLEPPLVMVGTTYVPLRFVAESFGADVNWKGDTQVVEIFTHHHDRDQDVGGALNPPPPVSADVQNNLFNWREVPQNETIPLQSALFDDNGYQILDTQGETILVPYAGDNLYTLMFAVSNTGGMYLVNYGDHPVLYLPVDGYLSNATIPDARWYPFTDYRPSQPIFLAVAPSRPDYDRMRWFHQMNVHGGYVRREQQAPPQPTINLSFSIGGVHLNAWTGLQQFASRHAEGEPIGQSHPEYYQWANKPHPDRTFQGNGSPVPTRSFNPSVQELPVSTSRPGSRQSPSSFGGDVKGNYTMPGSSPQHTTWAGNPAQPRPSASSTPQHTSWAGDASQQRPSASSTPLRTTSQPSPQHSNWGRSPSQQPSTTAPAPQKTNWGRIPGQQQTTTLSRPMAGYHSLAATPPPSPQAVAPVNTMRPSTAIPTGQKQPGKPTPGKPIGKRFPPANQPITGTSGKPTPSQPAP